MFFDHVHFYNATMVQVLLNVGYWKYEKWEYCEGPCQFFTVTSDVSEVCDNEFSIESKVVVVF